ncbi:glycosyltransferase family 2 protein [Flavobacterium columnare]|uniref:Glycosyl transferase n=1 Tax=Flavobacterium columnare (strain ATCC 49512 / CIP 103533 / TG 44/87) TaxID=1041826 RepID=G8X5X1_FLACA|nr:glycosyl transferase [Flavobacterium columnare]AEW85574.1 glycosyl transferase [Flavobacterium columnare ATCC 49512]
MKKVSKVFVVLTYRNTSDLKTFLKENSFSDSKIVIVNSFYDENSREEFHDIANNNDCDFINVANRGYGAGNNAGVDFALKNYDFEHLIICNPDVKINKFDDTYLKKIGTRVILAPEIKTKTGKDQNPFIINYNYFFRWLYYKAVTNKISILKYFVYAVNGLVRRLFIKFVTGLGLDKARVYSCHGSFFIIGKQALSELAPLYYEEMFLYHEEHFLARKTALKEIPIYFVPKYFSIRHYEDGSTFFNNKIMNDYLDDSYIKFFKFYYRNF